MTDELQQLRAENEAYAAANTDAWSSLGWNHDNEFGKGASISHAIDQLQERLRGQETARNDANVLQAKVYELEKTVNDQIESMGRMSDEIDELNEQIGGPK